ncbi:MAG: MBL fold metallo-hydrolase [Syntrophomonadaceae bacterium]|nr:MBL fold metallo-hydrolase [Syntrophomonadaceae bacterium]
MTLKISILVENTTAHMGMLGEWGLAMMIETEDKRYLFDTGSLGSIINNSRVMGLSMDGLDGIILSHGHADHTGGLLKVLEEHQVPAVYAHSRIFARRPLPGTTRQIGCAFALTDLEKAGVKMVHIDGFQEIAPGIFFSGEIPRKTTYENVGGAFQVEEDGELKPDLLEDDIALIIRRDDGLVIVSGCAHSGIINIIEHAIEKTGEKRILGYIGGTHLLTASPERLDQTITALQGYDIKKLIVSHCTGFYPAARLYNALGDKVVKGEAGMSFEF